MNQRIRLAAIDLDGTLFDEHSHISPYNQEIIGKCIAQGVTVIIATGRPYAGLPLEQLKALGVRYAITANGSAVYTLPEERCIYESSIPHDVLCPLIRKLQQQEIHLDIFVDGKAYSLNACVPRIDRLAMPESILTYIKTTRTLTDDLARLIETENLSVQKVVANFYPLPDGSFLYRDEAIRLLSDCPDITFLSGGYNNLEFTKAGTSKGTGLLFLCRYLNIPQEETLAIGDTQNDLDIIQTAAVGVAMDNAIPEVKKAADFITLSNEKDGVAHALCHFILGDR